MKIIKTDRGYIGIKPYKSGHCERLCDFAKQCKHMNCKNLVREHLQDKWPGEYTMSAYYLKKVPPVEVFCRKEGIVNRYRRFVKAALRVRNAKLNGKLPTLSLQDFSDMDPVFWKKIFEKYHKWARKEGLE